GCRHAGASIAAAASSFSALAAISAVHWLRMIRRSLLAVNPVQETYRMSGSSNVGMHIDHCVSEDPAKLAEFEAKIARGELIEADDWMPRAYREGMLKMAEHHANSEIIGALPEGEWITRAPSLKRKLALTAKVQDEVGHGQMLYRVSQDLGKSRDDMLRDLITGKTKYHNCFNYPAPTWGDIAMIQWLIDGAAI